MQPTIPQDAAFVLPLIAAGLTHWISSDRLPSWANALIATLFLVGTAILCAWLSGTFLLNSPQASVLAVLGYVVLLMRGSLKMILMYLESIKSPFDGPAPANANPVTSVGTSAYVPSDAGQPTAIPKRASAQQTTTPGS